MTCAPVRDEPDLACDRLGRDAVVSGDHDDADAGFPAAADRFCDLRSWRVDHADEAEQLELAFDLVGGCRRLREYAAGEGEHPQRIALHRGGSADDPRSLTRRQRGQRQNDLRLLP